jgi:hypothetical protein
VVGLTILKGDKMYYVVDVQQYHELSVTVTHPENDKLWLTVRDGRDDLTVNSSFLDTTENFELRSVMEDYAWTIYAFITDIRDGEKLEAVSSENRYESDGDERFLINKMYEHRGVSYEFGNGVVHELTSGGQLRDGKIYWTETLIKYKL